MGTEKRGIEKRKERIGRGSEDLLVTIKGWIVECASVTNVGSPSILMSVMSKVRGEEGGKGFDKINNKDTTSEKRSYTSHEHESQNASDKRGFAKKKNSPQGMVEKSWPRSYFYQEVGPNPFRENVAQPKIVVQDQNEEAYGKKIEESVVSGG
jgi:hypothetical protein